MRTLLAPLVLAAVGVFGVAAAAAAHGPVHGSAYGPVHGPVHGSAYGPAYGAHVHHGDARIFVGFGDVSFVRGRPYHRHLHRPLMAFGPPHAVRYFYYAPPPPVYVVPPRHHPRDYGRPGYPRYRDGYYR